MHSSYFWYDFETFGTDARRTRPAQFAGIRTDANFEIQGEPVVLYCQPSPDMLPHPEACLLTGITPRIAEDRGVREAEFFQKIEHHFTCKQGTCVVGYNSQRFDDEVVRFGFYRNFIDPYEWHWKNGNARWDIINLVRATYAFRPQGIYWPKQENGKPSFKLEDLARANGLLHEKAHDALSDVRATIALARLIREKQPRLFQFVQEHRSSESIRGFLDVRNPQPCMLTDQFIPSEQGHTTMIVPLVADASEKNAVWVYDLRTDPSQFAGLGPDELRERLFSKTAELEAEGKVRLPVRRIRLNQVPLLLPIKGLDPETERRLSINRDACMRNMEMLNEMPEFKRAVGSLMPNQGREPSDDPELALYDGFFSDKDKALIKRVRFSDPCRLQKFASSFEDKRLRELMFRYRARNWPETLSRDEVEKWDAWRLERIHDPRYEPSPQSYKEMLMDLRKNRPDATALIDDLERWAIRVLGQEYARIPSGESG